MSTALQVTSSAQLARPLKVLVPLILDDIRSGDNAGVNFYAAAGEKLWEAKSQFGSTTDFYRWAKKSCDRSERTIQTWMQYAVKVNGGQPLSFQSDTGAQRAARPQAKQTTTLSGVVNPNRNPGHQVAWYSAVQEAVNRVDVPRMKQERQQKEKEEVLRKKLGLQLIDIGYKALASKLHPDRGGSPEAMQRLNKVRDTLKGALRD